MATKKIKKTSENKGKEKYYEAIGRRKTAIARVRIRLAIRKKELIVNGKDFTEYFREKEYQEILLSPLVKTGTSDFSISIKVSGGGLRAQAFASRHGLSRALTLMHPESKTILKTSGFLTRDPRMKERKKPGLKGARRAPAVVQRR